MAPLVSAIITTKNEEKVIERLLKSIQKQTYKNVEIVIVDNRSADRTKEISKKYTNYVFNKGPERSVQRNFAVKKSKGKYLLILDADMEVTKNVIKECVELMESDKKVGAIAVPETPIARSFWEKVKAFERTIYNLEGDEATDAARFFPKRLFDKVGGYDEEITGPEDWDLPERIKALGYKIERIKARVKHHERVSSPFMVARKKYYYGLSSHRYLKKHKVLPISPKTIYFLRPVFYKNWKLLVKHPILTLAMLFMLILEQVFGGLGFLIGKVRNL